MSLSEPVQTERPRKPPHLPDASNVAAYLTAVAEAQPEAVAMYYPHKKRGPEGRSYDQITYRELDARSDAIALGLRSVGIERGDRVALMVKPSPELFALTFGLFKAGVVPVMVDPGIGLAQLKACLGRAAPAGFIGITAAHVARKVLGWCRGQLKPGALVTAGRRLFWGGKTLAAVEAAGAKLRAAGERPPPTDREATAAILFTSGSTGVPKGVVYKHRNFLAQVEALQALFDFDAGEIDLPTFPLFALFDPALGMTTVIPHMDPTKPAEVDPREIIEPIQKFGITTMFGSPALLNTVGRYGESHGVSLPSLRRVIAAGAPLPGPTIDRWHGMIEASANIYPPYGATETLPMACISSREIVGETWALTERGGGVCVGTPVSTIDLKVIGISDEPIETWSDELLVDVGEVGEIVVRGPMVTESYFADAENTRGHKIYEGDRVWHRVGDLGYLDEQGRLWFCGRKSQRVVYEGANGETRTLFTVPNEKRFDTHPAVYRSALVSLRVGGQTRPALCVERETAGEGVRVSDAELREQLVEMAKQDPKTADIEHVFFHPSFPVDIRHNAKIGREKLRAWAQEQVA